MQKLTIAFALALLVFAGCGPKSSPAAPTAPPQPKTEAAGTTETAAAAATNLPKLWDFFATWCPPCKQLAPTIEALEKEYDGKIEIKSIDTDQNKELAQKFNVQAIPTLVFLDAKGKELSRIVGLTSKDTIVARFKTHGFIQ